MKSLLNLVTFALLDILNSGANGYKILGVFPLAMKSHDMFCQSVIKTLIKRGHQMDVIVTQELENLPENLTIIYNMRELLPNSTFQERTLEELFSLYSSDPIKYISHDRGNFLCQLLANEKIQKIIENLKNYSDYDLFITEAYTMDCFMGLAHFMNIPLITLTAMYPWVEEAIGNPTTTATHPTTPSSLLEINSFWDRLINTVDNLVMKYKFYYYTDKIQTELIRKYISADLPSVRELAKSTILTLNNAHFTFNGIKPTTPGLIEVGGLHISQDETKFTPELEKWMDESVNGVIYFSMGSIIRVDSLQQETILAFHSVINKLKPIRFLIRARNVNNLFCGNPNNLKILPWIPQIPVLGHKNTKVFISHCGLLSSFEAVHFGVPVVGIPAAADQFFNMDQLIKKNMAVKLHLKNITEKVLYHALTLHHTDRPMSAENTTIYWIEYVLRNGGILKSPAVNLHWTQNELLDVYGFLFLVFLSTIYIITKMTQMIVHFINKSKRHQIEKKDN